MTFVNGYVIMESCQKDVVNLGCECGETNHMLALIDTRFNFIWRLFQCTTEAGVYNTELYAVYDLGTFNLEGVPLLDYRNNLPRYRLVGGVVEEILDNSIFAQNETLLHRYQHKITNIVEDLLCECVPASILTLYTAASTFDKPFIRQALNTVFTGNIPSRYMFQLFELSLRSLMRVHYIEKVEQRALTEDESAWINAILTVFKDDDGILGEPLSAESLSIDVITQALNNLSHIRDELVTFRQAVVETEFQNNFLE